MGDIQKSDEVLMTICSSAQGCFEMDHETGEPHGNCVYSELIQAGYTSDSLRSAEEKDTRSINFPHALVYTENRPAGPLDNMHPECLKLARIIQKCKLQVAILASENTAGQEEKDAFIMSFTSRKSGNSNENLTNETRKPTNQMVTYGNVSRTKSRESL